MKTRQPALNGTEQHEAGIRLRERNDRNRGGRPGRPSDRPVPERSEGEQGRPGGPADRSRPARDGERGRPSRPAGPNRDRGPQRDGAGVNRGRPSTPGRRPPPGAGPRPSRSRPNKPPAIQIKGDLLFGRNAILECLRAGRRQPTRLWLADGLRADPRLEEISSLAEEQEMLVDTVPRSLMDDMLPDVNHQGVLMESPIFPYADLEDIIEREGTVLILDHLQDPQNFGTLMRAAEAAGIAGAVIPADRAVEITPAVVNASSGAVEHLEVAQVPNLGRALEKLEQSGRWIVGLDSGEDAQDLYEADIPMPVALIVGSEGPGITQNLRKRCQMILELPMVGHVESLNAATAGSIVLFELVRRARLEE